MYFEKYAGKIKELMTGRDKYFVSRFVIPLRKEIKHRQLIFRIITLCISLYDCSLIVRKANQNNPCFYLKLTLRPCHCRNSSYFLNIFTGLVGRTQPAKSAAAPCTQGDILAPTGQAVSHDGPQQIA